MSLWEVMLKRGGPFSEADTNLVSVGDHHEECETHLEPTDAMTGNQCTCGYWELSERIWGEPKAPQTREEMFKDEWPWLYKYHRGLRLYPPFLHEVRP